MLSDRWAWQHRGPGAAFWLFVSRKWEVRSVKVNPVGPHTEWTVKINPQHLVQLILTMSSNYPFHFHLPSHVTLTSTLLTYYTSITHDPCYSVFFTLLKRRLRHKVKPFPIPFAAALAGYFVSFPHYGFDFSHFLWTTEALLLLLLVVVPLPQASFFTVASWVAN